MSNCKKVIIVVCDSLGRFFLGSSTPNLNRLRKSATFFERHHSIFPSVTRVASASIATGCLPKNHGLMGNSIALDEGQGLKHVSVGKPEFFESYRALKGRILSRPTLAQLVLPAGGSAIFSNVSAGAAYLQDPDGHGYLYHRDGSFGPGRRALPADEALAVECGPIGDRTMCERFCKLLRAGTLPTLSVIWFDDPDYTAHLTPLGSFDHLAAIANADANVARILSAMGDTSHRDEDRLLILCSDHGNQTVRQTIDINALLAEAGLKEHKTSPEVLAVSQGTSAFIYFSNNASCRVQSAASFLRSQSWVGNTFVGAELDQIGLRSEDGLEIAISMAASDELNSFGVPGLSDIAVDPFDPGSHGGNGQHGGLGNYEQAPFMMVVGRGFSPATSDYRRTSPLDIAPTALLHLGLQVPPMDGRALQL